MADKIRTRVTLSGGILDLKMLIFHPMESGLRKDAVTKKLIPRHFIDRLEIKLNEKLVMETHLSRSVSRNPFLHFRLKNTNSGDIIKISWTDNMGDSGKTEAKVP